MGAEGGMIFVWAPWRKQQDVNAGLGGQMRSGWLQSQGKGAPGNEKQKEREGEKNEGRERV